MNRLFLGILLIVTYSLAEKVRYDNFALFRLIPRDEKAVEILRNLEFSSPSAYDFWTPVRSVGVPVDVLVPPHLKSDFEENMRLQQIQSEILLKNVQEQIDKERFNSQYKYDFRDLAAYHTLEEIHDTLEAYALLYPDKVTIIEGGRTYENRTILGVKVSFNRNNATKAIFIDSGIHAREWITGAVNYYILNKILTSEDAEFRKVVEAFDWYIFPVINPDGYEYTWNTDRMWRKTRTPYQSCFGVDANRNWAYKWDKGGVSHDPCSDVYLGPSAFSDPSTASFSRYISTVVDKLVVYISFHSYSQLMLIPYGYTTEHLDNYNITYPVGQKAIASLAKRYGTKYQLGTIAEVAYIASGSNLDWIKGNYKVPFVYGYELRDTGEFGFLLPDTQIIPTGEETLDSIITILTESQKINGTSN